MAEQLTTRQRRILEVIRDAVADRGYPPSIREIGDAVGLTSTSSVRSPLHSIRRQPGIAAFRIAASLSASQTRWRGVEKM